MANPLYTMLTGQQPMQQNPAIPISGVAQAANPVQKMNYILQALRNPAAFVKQAIPDLPDNISNDPNQILQYLKQTRGVTDQQIQRVAGQISKF